MKQVVTACFALSLCAHVCAQKKPLDIAAAKNWPVIRNPVVNPAARQVAYQITDSTVILKTITPNTSDTFSIPNYKHHLSFNFDNSAKHLVFQSLTLRPKAERPHGDGVAVDLWSWKDAVLKSAELYQLTAPDSFITKDYFDITTRQKIKTDTVNWSWTGWQYAPHNIVLPRKFAKRLSEHFAKTDAVMVIGQLSKNEFVIARSSLTEPLNLTLTDRFKSFTPLSYVNPQKNYNWCTTEMFAPGGKALGMIYKPEDFNPAKKYPVIISLVDTRIIGEGKVASAYRNFHLPKAPWLYNGNITGRGGTGLYGPVLSNGILNTTYFASHGYVILEIPSAVVTGRPGPAMFEKVMDAVKELSKYNWVDTARLGIHGQGTSGYFVNYIITQTNIFKAAQESAGQTDLISHYGSVDGKGESMQPYYDAPDGFFGKTLWEDSAVYIWQSPVILANRIQTPLLMMHNKDDMITPFAQSIELFTGMRRLGNRCWLLQYDNEEHTLVTRENQEDFTIRLEQFFDHYLKGAGAPVWMTRGVAAKDKGVVSGLEIDNEIKTPPASGLVRKDTDRN